MKKKIIITGGTGYVGSRVAEKLLALGFSIIVVDIATPEERGIKFSNGITFRKHDLRITDEALKGLEGGDMVVHLAADIGSLTYMHDFQADIIRNNGAIDVAVYNAITKLGIDWILYSSSSMVFQHPKEFPYTEKQLEHIKLPTNVYGFSKLAGEYFCKAHAEQYGLNYTIVRYHNIYGPGEESKGGSPGDIHVIPALIEKVSNDQYPIEIIGSPQATRPFVYVDDAVEATVELTKRIAEGDMSLRNRDFNIGNDTYHTIEELAKIIWKMFGDERDFAYVVIPTIAITAERREVDISEIRNAIGWEPRTPLEHGLKKTHAWIKDRKEGKRSIWG